ncbi:hypothetical protein JCM8208_005587 [Rhodotorula glutinis]
MSLFASGSRALWRAAPAHATRARPFATATTTTTTEPVVEQSSPAPSTAPAPLPGSAVLPEAFRAQQQPASAPSAAAPATRSSRSSSAAAPFQAGDFLQHSNSRARTHRLTQPYKLHVYSTRNNTILTLSTSPAAASSSAYSSSSEGAGPHHPVAWVSAGNAGYKGAARGTYDAAVEVTLRMFRKIQDLVEPPVLAGGQRVKAAGPPPTELEVVWKGFGQGRDAVFRTLMGAEGDNVRGLVRRVTDATPLKVGGTRPKKRRVI